MISIFYFNDSLTYSLIFFLVYIELFFDLNSDKYDSLSASLISLSKSISSISPAFLLTFIVCSNS